MKRILSRISVSAVVILFTACGGGASAPAAAGFSQVYTTSATAGELMSYSIDTSAMTYSYTITKSSYGCEVSNASCHSGSGTLTKNSDGTYTPSGSPSSKIHALQNGLLTGSVTIALNGVSQRVPIIGVSNPITTSAGLAGTFNFISLQCTGRTYGVFNTGCATQHGSATVSANGTFTTCTGDNISANPHTCTNTVSGTVTSLGSGIWQFQATSPAVGAITNYLLAFSAPNGQKVAILDFNDAVVFGYGQATLSTQITTSSDLAGTYLWSNNYGSSGVVTLNSNHTTSSGLTFVENSPWDGLATVTGGGNGTGYGMIAGNGVYVYRNPTIPSRSAYLELGLKI